MSLNLNNKVVSAAIWSFIQRFGALFISFTTNILLARLLSPNDFGCMGILLVFVTIADVLVDGGLGLSLIQKQRITPLDISTVFTSNLVFSILFFLAILFSAPFIANYFNYPKIEIYLTVQSFALIFRAMYAIPSALLNKELKFKMLTKIYLLSNFISSISAIIMAYAGFGVWSLVTKNLALQFILFCMFWSFAYVKISVKFDFHTFKNLFKIGGAITFTNLTDIIFTNILSFLIGKKYSVTTLGYYTQAKALEQIPVYTLSTVINQVLFPVFSKIQDNEERIRENTKKCLVLITFFSFPIMAYLIIYAEPVITFLYSSKWLDSVPYFQILCIAGFVNPIIHINRTIIKSLGKAQLLVKTQLFSIIIGILILFIGVHFNIYILLLGICLYSFLGCIIVTYYSSQEIRYTLLEQFYNISRSLIITIIVSGFSFYLTTHFYHLSAFIFLLISLLIFLSLYTLFSFLFNKSSIHLVSEVLRKK